MPVFQLKITNHTEDQEDPKLNEKKKKATTIKVTEMLELSDKDFKAAIRMIRILP